MHAIIPACLSQAMPQPVQSLSLTGRHYDSLFQQQFKPFASDQDGRPVVFTTAGTACPHMLLAGAAGTGLTTACRVIALEAARRGIIVRVCCTNPADAAGLRGWPGVTAASGAPEMSRLISGTYDDMLRRYTEMESGSACAEDYPRLVVIIDDSASFARVVSGPMLLQASALLTMSCGARMNLVIASNGTGTGIQPADVRDMFDTRVALGQPSTESAQMMFGDAAAGLDIPCGSRGEGTALSPAGPVPVKVHWLPDPAGYPASLCSGDKALLRAVLPGAGSVHVFNPGTHGPDPRLPGTRPPPGTAPVTGSNPLSRGTAHRTRSALSRGFRAPRQRTASGAHGPRCGPPRCARSARAAAEPLQPLAASLKSGPATDRDRSRPAAGPRQASGTDSPDLIRGNRAEGPTWIPAYILTALLAMVTVAIYLAPALIAVARHAVAAETVLGSKRPVRLDYVRLTGGAANGLAEQASHLRRTPAIETTTATRPCRDALNHPGDGETVVLWLPGDHNLNFELTRADPPALPDTPGYASCI